MVFLKLFRQKLEPESDKKGFRKAFLCEKNTGSGTFIFAW
jgi:hypothetical protein